MQKKKIASYEQKKRLYGYVFVTPFIIGAIFLIGWPLIQSIWFSFNTLTATQTGYELQFVGTNNYQTALFVDPNFRKYLFQSVSDMAVNVPVVVLFAFFAASLLNQNFVGRGFARSILFLPLVLSSGILMRLAQNDIVSNMMSTTGGSSAVGGEGNLAGSFINFLTQLNINGQVIEFIASSVGRVYSITMMSAVPVVIFLAGLQSISPSIYEASYIEGATQWEVFWKISFPMVSPLILVSIVYCVIDSFTSASNVAIYQIHYTIFGRIEYGLGMSMVFIYMLIMLALLGVVYFIINKLVFYYD